MEAHGSEGFPGSSPAPCAKVDSLGILFEFIYE